MVQAGTGLHPLTWSTVFRRLSPSLALLCETSAFKAHTRPLTAAAATAVKPDRFPAELAAFICQRTLGLVALPEYLEAAVEEITSESNLSARTIRKHGRQLVAELQSRARSTSRGGVQELRLVPQQPNSCPPVKPSKAVQAAKKAMKALQSGPFLHVDGRSSQDLAAIQESLDERLPAPGLGPVYDGGATAAAYNVMRMPACYAVAFRVLRELRIARPLLNPSSLLDFGAGPGTAIWAAQEVWPDMLQHVSAVEPSSAMAGAGHSIRDRLRDQYPAPIRWHSALDAHRSQKHSSTRQSDRRAGVYKQHDIVTAVYVLCEMDPALRQRTVAALWRRAGKALVLLEPGTPAGSATIRAARQQILESEAAGAVHVVAPCPHEGRCPLDGTTSWCHFPQRFTRTRLQASAKVLSSGAAARDYQDERFSYVVLARGQRPALPAAQADAPIASFLQDDPRLDAPIASRPAEEPGFPALHAPGQAPAHGPDVGSDREHATGSDSEDALHNPDANLCNPMSLSEGHHGDSELRSVMDQLIDESIALGDDSDNECHGHDSIHALQLFPDSGQDAALQSVKPTESCKPHLQAASSGQLDGTPYLPSTGASSSLTAADPAVAPGSDTTQLSAPRAVQAEVPASAEDASLHASPPAPFAADSQAHPHHFQGGLEPSSSSQLEPAAVDSTSAEEEEEEEEEDLVEGMSADDHWRACHPEQLERAAAASSPWSRIIRRPRKRRQHILVDVCTAGPSRGLLPEAASLSGLDHTAGRIVRQAVGSGDRQHWLGPAGYRIVRKARWGDLWPGYYQSNAITQK